MESDRRDSRIASKHGDHSMSAQQLTMFEPTGSELATLARSHADQAHALQLKADALTLRGFTASSRIFANLCHLSDSQAIVCEMALQFEQLAGLS